MIKLPLLLVLASSFAVAPAVARDRPTPDAQLAKLLDGRTAGKPVDCISLSSANNSQVINGKAIVYKIGGTYFVNSLRGDARGLDDDDVLVTNTVTNRLCSTDSVRLVDRFTGFQTGFVLLGEFVPYKKAG
jgi:hypothetical protein